MFAFDPITKGLELLAQRELQGAEHLFLRVINDPYAQNEEQRLARHYLNDIRACQSGATVLDFTVYSKLARKTEVSLNTVYELLGAVYFSSAESYREIDQEIGQRLPAIITPLKQVKIRDIIVRDKLLTQIEKRTSQEVRKRLDETRAKDEIRPYRLKTIHRKFVRQINPILLERHLEMLEYVLDSGDMSVFEDAKLTVLTPKCIWILESTLKAHWYLLRSYFFKSRAEVRSQFVKKEGTRKYWEEVRSKKTDIFEKCGFDERNIQKFLYIDKLNYKSLEEVYRFARELEQNLIPRDVSLALRGVSKAKDHIRERSGQLLGVRDTFRENLLGLGFGAENAYKIARRAKKAHCLQIGDTFSRSLQIARDEICWYRIPPVSPSFRRDLEHQCLQHLSTVRIHLFDRGRLNKLLLQSGKGFVRDYLIRIYGADVVNLHCYFRLETIHQYYKLKFFQYHARAIPSVSELIKISREDFRALALEAYRSFLKKRRVVMPPELYRGIAAHRSATGWEDPQTTTEEKILLKCWFLMDHGFSVSQGVLNKGVLAPGFDILAWMNMPQEPECKS